MTVKIRLEDGKGSGNQVHVDERGFVSMALDPSPPLAISKSKIFRQYLTRDGTTAGSNTMLIDASSTNVTYFVKASLNADRYITSLSFVIADDGVDLDEFGAVTALTNGCELFYESLTEEITIHGALKSNWDFIRLCLGNPAFGTGADLFIANKIEGKVSAVIPVLNLKELMPPYGIKLDMGTQEKLAIKLRDSTTGIDAFNCIAYGFDRST